MISSQGFESMKDRITSMSKVLESTWGSCFANDLARQRELDVVKKTITDLYKGIQSRSNHPTSQGFKPFLMKTLASMESKLARLSSQERSSASAPSVQAETKDDIAVGRSKTKSRRKKVSHRRLFGHDFESILGLIGGDGFDMMQYAGLSRGEICAYDCSY